MKHGQTHFEVRGDMVRITGADGCMTEVPESDVRDFTDCQKNLYSGGVTYFPPQHSDVLQQTIEREPGQERH